MSLTVSHPFCPPVIKRLLNHVKEGSGREDPPQDKEWTDKAVRSLVKKLKRSGLTGELEKALSTQGSQRTACVSIPRSLDGRLQIAHRKGLPHVIYCRLFRWPSLQTHHELKALDCCEFAFQLKKDDVCVNPYHYERVEAPALPPVIISGDGDRHQMGDYSIPAAAMGLAMDETEIPENQSTDYPSDMAASCYSPAGSAVTSSYASSIPPETPPPGYHLDDDLRSPGGSISGSTASMFSSAPPGPRSSGGSDSFRSSPPLPYSPRSAEVGDVIHYQDSPHWCEIRYYEMAQRVGDIFAATIPSITVNGFVDETAKDRFCLGLCTNPHRTTDAENVRRHIKRGVRLTYIGGEVFAECQSDSPIFIQSASSNARYKWNKSTVCKVPPGCHLKIFNNEEFAAALKDSVAKGVQSVHDLLRLVNIRISFIKGWGVVYSRKKATQCPCWIEIQLTGPLAWLDKVMNSMSALPPGSSRT